MNNATKIEFINDLIDSVRADIIAKVESMPEEWDGIELRQIIARKFTEQSRPDLLRGKRGNDFRTAIYTNNI